MCQTLSRRLLPILVLVALSAGVVAAHAEDDGAGAGLGAAPMGQTRDTARAPRIYVPLRAAQPREIEEEFAPLKTTTFGAHAGRTPHASEAPHGGAAAKAAPPDNRTDAHPDTQSAQAPPDGG